MIYSVVSDVNYNSLLPIQLKGLVESDRPCNMEPSNSSVRNFHPISGDRSRALALVLGIVMSSASYRDNLYCNESTPIDSLQTLFLCQKGL